MLNASERGQSSTNNSTNVTTWQGCGGGRVGSSQQKPKKTKTNDKTEKPYLEQEDK